MNVFWNGMSGQCTTSNKITCCRALLTASMLQYSKKCCVDNVQRILCALGFALSSRALDAGRREVIFCDKSWQKIRKWKEEVWGRVNWR